MQNGIDIVIYGNSLFDRLIKLKIDEDILYKQFSVMKFQRVIEESILRKSKKCKIVFSKDNIYYNKDLICRIEAEGIPVIVLESRLQCIEFVCQQIRRTFELVLVSTSDDLVSKVSLEKDNYYLYTVSFENDLPKQSSPIFFSRGDITSMGLNHCL